MVATSSRAIKDSCLPRSQGHFSKHLEFSPKEEPSVEISNENCS